MVTTSALRSGQTRSCGCLRLERESGKISRDFTGQKSNMLTAVKFDYEKSKKMKQNFWLCKCDCGSDILVSVDATTFKNRTRIGCSECLKTRIGEAQKTHGKKGSRIYYIWCSMKSRCTNPQTNGYEIYGGRGITVCSEWQNFTPFYEWAKNNGYDDKMTIDRINKDGNYEPKNCRWVSRERQMRNLRNTIYVHYEGDKWVLLDLLEHLGLDGNYDIIRGRINQGGWGLKDALEVPIGMPRNHHYFMEGLKKEFGSSVEGHKIAKSDFLNKYVSSQYHHRFATYVNNKHIKDCMDHLGIKNNKHYIEKLQVRGIHDES